MNDGRKRSRGPWLLAALVMVTVLAFGARFRALRAEEATPGVRETQLRDGFPVETVTARTRDLARWTTVAGTVEGSVQYAVEAAVALRVERILVREGDRVEPGQVLLHLAGDAPTSMYRSPDRARTALADATRTAERMRKLFAAGAVAQADLDAAETALALAEVELANAQDASVLRASGAGVVSRIEAEAGETAQAGEALVWITDAANVRVRFEAGGRQAPSLAVGQAVRLRDEAGGTVALGELSRLDGMADPRTHLLGGEAAFANPAGRLVPGLLVTLEVRVETAADAVTVPRECLVEHGDGRAVWVLDGEGRARLRPVAVGLAEADEVQLLAGVAAGETVVRHGQTLLTDGAATLTVGAGEA
ncbi:MAG TPA: efflux RND transporter periplasmic adaptor subunit [Candidatus Krumholzibacteria bacterium]|nr:efflux RND transporter periplasmic adaptor subunit [Candidatus Krumholzibacteria bacterium]HRX52556.1 efflux RND transporter periplasmic adaptor subunit [Candidatus Krumholzibacteria bacterium]